MGLIQKILCSREIKVKSRKKPSGETMHKVNIGWCARKPYEHLIEIAKESNEQKLIKHNYRTYVTKMSA